MKFFANILIALIVCTMTSALAPDPGRDTSPVYKIDGTYAEVSVGNMVPSTIRHKDAAVYGTSSFRSLENSARVKGGKTHYAQMSSPIRKEKGASSPAKRPCIYKNHSNISISSSRSADKYIFALERIII